MKENDVRIIKADAHNYAVQQVVTRAKDKPNERLEWENTGYFGAKLDWAAESALFKSFPSDTVISRETINDAVQRIVEGCKL